MAVIHQALVRITMPQLDPLDDAVSISLAYGSQVALGGASDTGLLVNNVPNLINVPATGAVFPMASYLGPQIDRRTNHARIDVYDIGPHLDGTPHGSPVDGGTFTVGAIHDGSTTEPDGVAACVSFRADYGSDVEFGAPTGVETGRLRPRARDRGRFYLGPVNSLAIDQVSATGRCIWSAVFIADALASLQSVCTISNYPVPGNANWSLSVWSRKNATLKKAAELWMDDRPDYQRRRTDPGLKTFRSAV
jgi:hypothetical protein